MNDFFQQFKKQQEINESLFGNLFGKKPKQQPVTPIGPEIIQNSNNTISIKFENGSSAQEVNTIAALPYLQRLDFHSSKFSFLNLPGTKFNATYLGLNLQTQEVEIFKGEWEAGPFNGGHFEGKFNGSSFEGDFTGNYTDWEAHPTAFVDGTFIDITDSGLLGSPNMITLPTDVSDDTNLIFIPKGYYLQFRTKNGVSGYIKTIKRLDNVNSDCKFEVLDGFKSQTAKILNLSWTQVRQSWNTLFVDPKSVKSVAGIIQIPDGDEITEMYISSALATFKNPAQQYNPATKYVYSLSKIPYLSIKTFKGAKGKFAKPEVYLKFDSQDEFKKFEEITSNIKTGVFSQDIKDIAKAIKYGEIDGYAPYSYLKFVFDNKQGSKVVPAGTTKTRKKTVAEATGTIHAHKFQTPALGRYSSEPIASEVQYGPATAMARLNDFVRYFVENLVDDAGEPDETAKELVITRLKKAIGWESAQQSTAPAVNQPGMTPGNLSQQQKVSKFTIKESIRSSVRNIINDNF